MNSTIAETKPVNELVQIESRITKGLEAFEQRKNELIELKGEADGLQITSIEDRAAINQVTTIRKKLKAARVIIEKEGKSMRDPLTQVSRMISEKERELIGIIEPTEKKLLEQERWVENELARIENERIQARIDALSKWGYQIDYAVVSSLDDAAFSMVLRNAEIQYNQEQAEIAEQKRLQEIEDKKREEERKELEELRKKQAEADRILREHEQQKQARAREEEEKLQSILKARADERTIQLIKLGFKFNEKYECFEFEDINIDNRNTVTHLDDSDWYALLEKLTPEIAERKENAAKGETERIEALKKEAREQALKEKEEADRQARAAQNEKLALASDKVKFRDVYNKIEQLGFPEFKSIKSNKVMAQIRHLQTQMLETIKPLL